MADSVSPFISLENPRSSFPSSIAHTPLTEYFRHSQPADSQAIPNGETTDSQTNVQNPYPCVEINSNTSMCDRKSPLPYDFDTMHSPSLQTQVLVPNPLLSDVANSDGCVSIDQHCHGTSSVLSSPLSLERLPFDGNLVPYLKTSLHEPSLVRTPITITGTLANASQLGLNDILPLTVSGDLIVAEAYSPEIPVLSTAETLTKSNIIPERYFPLVCRTRKGATQQHHSGFFQPGSESPILINANEGHCNESYVPLHPETTHAEKECKDESEIAPEEIQIRAPFQVADASHAREVREKDHYFMPVSPSTFERCQSGLEADSTNASHETTVLNSQALVTTEPTNFLTIGQLSGQNCTEGQRTTVQAGKCLDQQGKLQNTVYGVSRSSQSNTFNSKVKVSPALQYDPLMETSFLDGQGRSNLTDSSVLRKQPPGKRRRLHSSDEEQIEYQEYKPVEQYAEPISRQINSCSGVLRFQGKEFDLPFARKRIANVSHEYQRLDQSGCDISDDFPVWGRTYFDVTCRKEDETNGEEKNPYLGTKKSLVLEQNLGEKQNEQGHKRREMLEPHENVSERNGTVFDQQHFISSGKGGAPPPSYIVRSVERKEGCMFMVLEVHEPAVCQSCDKRFPTQELLDLHVGKKHKGSARRRYRKRKRDKKEYRCTVCCLRLANDANLRRHYQIVHEGETVETCSLCNANFNSHHGFVLHLRDQHGITPDSVQDKEGKNGKKRQYRRRNAINVVPKPTWVVWKCGSCSFFSENKGNMTRHINIVHLKIADHVCEECSEVFKTKHNLQVHLMNRHPKKLEASAGK